jgi:hypothetical protein
LSKIRPMRQPRTIEVTHFKNPNDKKNLVQVPLDQSDRPAILYEDDFALLMDMGVSPRWSYNAATMGHVKCYCGGKALSIARILVDAGKGERIQFLNCDRTDLRRDNLVIAKGAGILRDRDYLLKSHRFLPNRPEVKHVVKTSDYGAGCVML